MDPVSSARSARESLARGLAALQSPGLPPQLMNVADPVAQAMGALHRIEATGGAAIAEAAPQALAFVRQALALLQSQGIQHPAVDQSMEAIAGSLGLVHQLSQVGAAPAPMQAVSPYAGTMMMDQGQFHPPASAAPATQPSNNLGYVPRPEPKPQVAYANPAPAQPGAGWQPPAAAAPPEPAWQPPPQNPAATQPAWQPPPERPPAVQQPPAWQPPPAVAPAVAVPPQAAPAQPGAAAAHAMPAGGAPRVEAALGAHSPTNFYKGLSGNDVIDSGGIFIATYQILPIGTQVMIHVSLPGGYEFDSLAVVRWTREAPHSTRGEESPPGFGAQFVQISPEGRQLVYRYVRNREPLFHDDL